MSQVTSRAAFEAAMGSGLIAERQRQVFEIVCLHGPLTANEAFNFLQRRVGRAFRFDSNTRARFTELRELGVIEEAPARLCSVSHRRCIVWRATGNAPVRPPRRVRSRARIAELEGEVARLNQIISDLNTVIFAQQTSGGGMQLELFG